MFWIIFAVAYWIIMALCVVSSVMISRSHRHDELDIGSQLDEVVVIGACFALLVDLAWGTLMLIRIVLTWQNAPGLNWNWVDQHITLPWIAPQFIIVVGFLFYVAVMKPKPTAKV